MNKKNTIILFSNAESDVDFIATRKATEILLKLGRQVVFCPLYPQVLSPVSPVRSLPTVPQVLSLASVSPESQVSSLASVSSLSPVSDTASNFTFGITGITGITEGRAEDYIQTAEMIITFGGDGTILRAARIAADAGFGTPILGINVGHTGFMAEIEDDETDMIAAAANGKYTTESRMMLDVEILRGDEVLKRDFALNDVVVRGDNKVIDLTIFGDDQRISAFYGDGTVIATPTGSTAYSMAAGGPLVEPTAHNIIVTPICAHFLEARSFVLASERIVTVKLGNRNRNHAYISADGGDHIMISNGDVISVRKSSMYTNFMRVTDRSFYKKVSEKLGGQG